MTHHSAPAAGALFCDLYELTMAQAYARQSHTGEAVFSLFVRALPERRNALIACGLETLLDDIEGLCFTSGDIAYLRSTGRFDRSFLDSLSQWRFSGEIRAVPEGTPIFPQEPLLEVKAPIAEAQLLETLIMNRIGLQTMLASKAARVVAAAQGRTVVDFAGRRMHGLDAALNGARAFYIAGVHATANCQAGAVYDLPIAGTMAHSFIQSFDEEAAAFQAFAETFPGTTLLVDTYDTLRGVDRVIALIRHAGLSVGAVRLDSGDMATLARGARARLDDAGLRDVQIFASGGLDEDRIARLLADGAPIDGFGVGTAMGVSDDAPALDIAYKLVSYGGEGRAKTSPGKASLPGPKQVYRAMEGGRACGDTLATATEPDQQGAPLLETVMRKGQRTRPAPRLDDLRQARAAAWATLPAAVQAIHPASNPYPVTLSPTLADLRDTVRAKASA